MARFFFIYSQHKNTHRHCDEGSNHIIKITSPKEIRANQCHPPKSALRDPDLNGLTCHIW